jgi:ferritin
MAISSKLNEAINQQIGNEFAASLQYVAIASYLADQGLLRLSARFFAQAEEERDHAMRFVRYLNELDAPLVIPVIPAPQATFESVEAAVALALDRERTVTRQINALMDQAMADRDYLSQEFLAWYVKEQLEEEATLGNLLKVIRRAGEGNLYLVEANLPPKADDPVKPEEKDE